MTEENNMSKISMTDVVKTYDGKTNILDKVSLEVQEGEFFILVGPSGCGKSTLLRMIAGLEKINGGILRIDGDAANDMLPKDRNLSMVFQNYALYPHMTVKDNIIFGLDVKKVPKKEQLARMNEAAEMLGLSEYLKRKPRELSGGQRQRIALARSICSQAPICLMDEPLSNLDAKLRGQMRTEIKRIQRKLGLTVVYVTHDQVEAMTMGDRILVLQGGKIQQTGTPLELYNSPSNTFVAGFIGSPQMNMAEAELTDKGILLNGCMLIPADREQRSKLPEGRKWKAGIRAEQIDYAKSGLSVTVANTEMMGNETQVIFFVGSGLFTARWQGQFESGSEINVSINPDAMHFFDIDTGSLLRPAILKKAICN